MRAAKSGQQQPAASDRMLDMDAIISRVSEQAGFERLKDILKRRFFDRKHILRCYHVLTDAHRVLVDIEYKLLQDIRERNKVRRERFFDFIRQSAYRDPDIARELEVLVQEYAVKHTEQVERLLEHLKLEFELASRKLNLHNKDFEALQDIMDRFSVLPGEC